MVYRGCMGWEGVLGVASWLVAWGGGCRGIGIDTRFGRFSGWCSILLRYWNGLNILDNSIKSSWWELEWIF